MFPGSSPRRQSVGGYPGYTGAQPSYDYSGVTGPGHHGYGGPADGQQWPGYPHLYSRYDDWNHHAASAAAAVAAASHFQPPSPGAVTHEAGDPGSGGLGGLYGNYGKSSSLAPPVGDFKPPVLSDLRAMSNLDQDQAGGEADPLRSQQVITGGRAHHSPDSGLAASDGVSGSDSPGHGQPQQPPSPGLHHDLGLPSRPQPARSPYEWMKRPNVAARPCKEGSDGKTFFYCYLLIVQHLGRTRTKDKYRVVYSDHQRLELEKEFHYSRYITIRRKAELAQALTLSERQV